MRDAEGKSVTAQCRIDVKTGKVQAFPLFVNAPPGRHSAYQFAMDSKGNAYRLDYGAYWEAPGESHYVWRMDGQTGKTSFVPTPTAKSFPRRGAMDAQDRFWFGEYFGDKIAMFDAKTKTFKEWATPKWTAPYTASVPNRKGHVFAPSNSADRVFRLDPKTGEILAYLMPTMNFDTKEMSIDPVSGTAVLFANTRNAQIMRVEPLD